MFNIGPGELIVIALVLLIAVGPEQLPGLIRRVGQVAGQAREMTDSLRSEFMSGMEELERATDPNAWAASAGPSPDRPQPAIPGAADKKNTTDSEDDVQSGEEDSDADGPEDLQDNLSADEGSPADDGFPADDGSPADDDHGADDGSAADDHGGADEGSTPAPTTGTWAPLEPGPAADLVASQSTDGEAGTDAPRSAPTSSMSSDDGEQSGESNGIDAGATAEHRANGSESAAPVDDDDNPRLEESA